MAVDIQPAGGVHKGLLLRALLAQVALTMYIYTPPPSPRLMPLDADSRVPTPPPAYAEYDAVRGPFLVKTQFSEEVLAVPGLWGFREGKERCIMLDMEFILDEMNARAVDRWARRQERFE